MSTLPETTSSEPDEVQLIVFQSLERPHTIQTQNPLHHLGFSKENVKKYNYVIILWQLITQLVFVTLVTLHDPTKQFIISNPDLYMKASLIIIGALGILLCLTQIPLFNYIYLFVFFVCGSFMMATSVSNNYSEQLFLVLCLITFICFPMSIIFLHVKVSLWHLAILALVILILDIFILFPDTYLHVPIILRDLVKTGFNNIFVGFYLQRPYCMLYC